MLLELKMDTLEDKSKSKPATYTGPVFWLAGIQWHAAVVMMGLIGPWNLQEMLT